MIRAPQIRQVGALPWRRAARGLEILLVTSRETKRWVIPKGWAMAGMTEHGAAAREAYEEAGVEGVTAPVAAGYYDYDKARAGGPPLRIRVDVFPLEVVRLLDRWPERKERERRWFSTSEAASAVQESELAALIWTFAAR